MGVLVMEHIFMEIKNTSTCQCSFSDKFNKEYNPETSLQLSIITGKIVVKMYQQVLI